MKVIKNSWQKLENFYNKEFGRVILSLVMTIIFFSVLYLKSAIVFFINDDENIMYTLAGYYTNGETADHSFVNYILGRIIRWMYELIPQIPWYGVLHIFVLFVSVVVVGRGLFKISHKVGLSVFYPISMFTGICVIFFVNPVILMQFTTTSALAGTAAVSLLICIDELDSGKSRCVQFVFSVIFVLLCYMHRKNTGYIVLCFFSLTAFYKFFEHIISSDQREAVLIKNNTKKGKGFLAILAISLITVIAVSIISQNLIRTTSEWKSFYEYDEARFKMTDYPHDSIYDNPDLYNKIGWSESLYKLAGTSFWFFMDEKINVDSFNEISATGYNDTSKFDTSLIIDRALQLFSQEFVAQVSIVVCSLLFLLIVIICIIQKKYLDVLMACCTLGGVFCTSLYLCWKGRFILRAYQVIIFPAAVIFAFLFLKNLTYLTGKFGKKKIWKAVVTFIGLIVLCAGINIYWKAGYEAAQRVEKTNRTLAVEEYAINHPENMYFYDTSLTFRYSPFVVYTDDYPSNLMFWGGMGWKSPAFNKQLEMNGLDHANSDIFFEEDVYYITYPGYILNSGSTMMDMFSAYINDSYGEVEFKLVDDIDSEIYIYKIEKR